MLAAGFDTYMADNWILPTKMSSDPLPDKTLEVAFESF